MLSKKKLHINILLTTVFLLTSCGGPSAETIISQADVFVQSQNYNEAINIYTDYLNEKGSAEIQEKLEQVKQEKISYELVLKINSTISNVQDDLYSCKTAKELRSLVDTTNGIVQEIDSFESNYNNIYTAYINSIKNDGFYKTFKDEYLSHNMIMYDDSPFQSTMTDLVAIQIETIIEGSFLFYDNPVSTLSVENEVSSAGAESNMIDIPKRFKEIITQAANESDSVVCKDGFYGAFKGMETVDSYQKSFNNSKNECIISSSLFHSIDSNEYTYAIYAIFPNDKYFDLSKVFISNGDSSVDFPAEYFEVLPEINYYSICVRESSYNLLKFDDLHKMLAIGKPITITFKGIEQEISIELNEKQMESFIIISSIFQELQSIYELDALS